MKCFDLKKFVSSWRKELVGLAVLVGVVSLVLLVLWLFGQITFVEQKVTIVKIITGLLVLVGLYWTSRRVLAAEKTVRVAEEGQITERFTRAIAQLGDDKMAIRLGGIYALERIAKDSEKDHGPIMEILTAYVREKAPRQEVNIQELDQNPPTDIQAILTVLSRRETTGKNRGKDPLDLRGTHLHGVVIPPHGNLSGADLGEANLILARLNGADLGGANLILARLNGADLGGANLRGAKLGAADLSAADLNGTDLSAADLNGTDLSESENLTAEQVRSAKNWRKAILPDYLQYLLTEPPA